MLFIASGDFTRLAVPLMREILGDKRDLALLNLFDLLERDGDVESGVRARTTVVMDDNGFVVYCDGNPIGSYDLMAYVSPRARRKGVGTNLVTVLIQHLRCCLFREIPRDTVRTWHGSEAADKFWRKFSIFPPHERRRKATEL